MYITKKKGYTCSADCFVPCFHLFFSYKIFNKPIIFYHRVKRL